MSSAVVAFHCRRCFSIVSISSYDEPQSCLRHQDVQFGEVQLQVLGPPDLLLAATGQQIRGSAPQVCGSVLVGHLGECILDPGEPARSTGPTSC